MKFMLEIKEDELESMTKEDRKKIWKMLTKIEKEIDKTLDLFAAMDAEEALKKT